MMQKHSHQRDRRSSSTGPDFPAWVLTLVGGIAVCILALPALVLGLLLQHLARTRSWHPLLWLTLIIPGTVLLYVLYTHGLDRLVLTQLLALVQSIKQHHADLAQWDLGQLWSLTWPVWLRTVVVVPIIALWRDLESGQRGGGEAFLRRREERRKQAVAQSKHRATRRARHRGRIPDAVAGQMVIGVPIADEEAQ